MKVVKKSINGKRKLKKLSPEKKPNQEIPVKMRI